MNKHSLIQGGHFRDKGYHYDMYITLPQYKKSFCTSIVGTKHKSIKISFPTKFMLTNNSVYFNMVISLLGFGIGLEIHSRS